MRRAKVSFFSGCNSHLATVAPASSNRSGSGGNDAAGAFDGKGRFRRLREQAGRNVSERRAGLETANVGADPPEDRGRPVLIGEDERGRSKQSHRGTGDGMHDREIDRNTGSPSGEGRELNRQPAREGPGRTGWRIGP